MGVDQEACTRNQRWDISAGDGAEQPEVGLLGTEGLGELCDEFVIVERVTSGLRALARTAGGIGEPDWPLYQPVGSSKLVARLSRRTGH
jgi:hypothetical protein